ncbi:TIGR01777 family oxidoreductase [Pantoea sp. 1.19]|uniref:TIGR01777 family oxidoreductase n=1 Tax=Pantoea sp. 1.19 TaxID=1925589 RepID=UPI000948E98A|nr:TIGR01777 family oxidoreductase [Pantoea sp. 1.19]
MKILLTGATGLIGTHLVPRLLEQGHELCILTRNVAGGKRRFGDRVSWWSGLDQQQDLNGIDAVINLAGEPIADKRWTPAQKQRLCDSRWTLTKRLSDLIRASSTPPGVVLSGSATGYYGDAGETVVTEEDSGKQEFTHTLCARWETLAQEAESPQTRVCLMRIGVVLAREGGALAKMRLPFKLGLGGPVGSGKQYMPWIHVDDVVGAMLFLLNDARQHGPYNLVAPYAVRNEQFVATLGEVMHRPAMLPMPAPALRLLMGEGAALLLASAHVLPRRLEEAGYRFRWYRLEEALQDVV